MRYIKFFICFIILVVVSSAWADQQDVSKLNALLSGVNSYQANFNQVTFDSRQQVMQRGHGRMMMKRPGRFRWETETPSKEIMITDGKTLWIYNVDLAQVTRQPLSERDNINPASLLSGSITELNKKFKVDKVANNSRFVLRPRGDSDFKFKWIQLKFAKGRLVEMRVLNNLDQTNVFRFSEIKVNSGLANSLFQFKPPRGVDVIKQ